MIDGHFKTDRKKYVIVWLHRNTGRKRERRKYYEIEIINRYYDCSNGNVFGSNTCICRKYELCDWKSNNVYGTFTYRAMTSYPNKKATANAMWFMNISSLNFAGSIDGTSGITFKPMLRSGNSSYTEVEDADAAWAKTTMSTKYYSWNGHGPANVTYYLGVRLDNRLRNTSATASGYWNAN